MEVPNMIGKRLKEARKAAGLTQEELADLVQIDTSASRISHYESGTHSPNYEFVCLIGEKLNIPECWFYCRDDRLAGVILSFHRQQSNFHLLPEDVQRLGELGEYLEKLNSSIRGIIKRKDSDDK
jgi:transcriptional regulator with XRE-family HTH domain